MREILFRGKRLENGEWVVGHLCKSYLRIGDTCICCTAGLRFYPVSPTTVGQYTGLKDKNGKRIFEGDICRNAMNGDIVFIKWHGTMAGFVWSRPKKDVTHLYDFGELFRVYDKYEVIGNIHDNQDLLQDGAGG